MSKNPKQGQFNAPQAAPLNEGTETEEIKTTETNEEVVDPIVPTPETDEDNGGGKETGNEGGDTDVPGSEGGEDGTGTENPGGENPNTGNGEEGGNGTDTDGEGEEKPQRAWSLVCPQGCAGLAGIEEETIDEPEGNTGYDFMVARAGCRIAKIERTHEQNGNKNTETDGE